MVLLSDTDVEKGDAVVCPLVFASHRIKRVCASSLSVEALSVNAAVQQGDFVRALLAEILCADFDIRRWEQFVDRIRMIWVTDCRSVYDHLTFDRGLPRDKRLAIELAALKQSLCRPRDKLRWMPGRRLLVDALAKCLSHPDILITVFTTGLYSLVDTPEEAAHRAAVRERERARKEAKKSSSNL